MIEAKLVKSQIGGGLARTPAALPRLGTTRQMTNSQSAIAAAIRLLELEGYTVSRRADPTAWDYTLLRKSQELPEVKRYDAKGNVTPTLGML